LCAPSKRNRPILSRRPANVAVFDAADNIGLIQGQASPLESRLRRFPTDAGPEAG